MENATSFHGAERGIRNRVVRVGLLPVAAGLMVLAGCGSHPVTTGAGQSSFAMISSKTMSVAGAESPVALAELKFAKSRIGGGASTLVTVTLAQPAPAGGLSVSLVSSEPDIVHVPSSLTFTAGQSSRSFTASTVSVTAPVQVTIRAQTGTATVGSNLSVFPAAAATSTSVVQPIAATAGDKGLAATTTLDFDATSPIDATSPNATFKGCWYKASGRRYQGVDVTVGTPGIYAFNAILYHGTTCNPADWADQFGFGQLINFGGGLKYTFWFTAFSNQSDMSAVWYVGNQKSKCVSYLTAPNC